MQVAEFKFTGDTAQSFKGSGVYHHVVVRGTFTTITVTDEYIGDVAIISSEGYVDLAVNDYYMSGKCTITPVGVSGRVEVFVGVDS